MDATLDAVTLIIAEAGAIALQNQQIQDAPGAAIAIVKRMDALELNDSSSSPATADSVL